MNPDARAPGLVPPLSKDDRALTMMTLLFAGGSMVAYPAIATYGNALVLLFAIPMTIATAGRLQRSVVLQRAALVAGLIAAVTLFTGPALVPQAILLFGPAAVVMVISRLLRSCDRVTAIIWAAGAVVAFATGVLLVAVSPSAAAGVAMLVMTIATLISILRVRRRLFSGE